MSKKASFTRVHGPGTKTRVLGAMIDNERRTSAHVMEMLRAAGAAYCRGCVRDESRRSRGIHDLYDILIVYVQMSASSAANGPKAYNGLSGSFVAARERLARRLSCLEDKHQKRRRRETHSWKPRMIHVRRSRAPGRLRVESRYRLQNGMTEANLVVVRGQVAFRT